MYIGEPLTGLSGKENGVPEKQYSSEDLMSIEPMELEDYLRKNFSIRIPASIETVDDLRTASAIISRSYAYYSYLMPLRQLAKIHKRALKRQKESSEEIEKMLTREELFETYASVAKCAYDTVSRMVTIKSQITQELKMLSLA
jgi:hypothetical protein